MRAIITRSWLMQLMFDSLELASQLEMKFLLCYKGKRRKGTSALLFVCMQYGYQSQSLDHLFFNYCNVTSSTIQFWIVLSKGHST